MTNKALEQLTGPGGPFEFTDSTVNGMDCRIFKDTPRCLTSIYQTLEPFAELDLAVFDGRRLTYRQALDQAAVLAHYLKENYSIAKGDRVAIVMRNAPEWLVTFIAITSLGAIPALVNSRGTADEISYCVILTKCQLLITDARTQQGLDEFEAGSLPRITFDLSQSFTLDGHDSALGSDSEQPALPLVDSAPDEVAIILFTSGTTGRPKAALLSHLGVVTALKTNQYSSAVIGVEMAERYGIDIATLAANRPQTSTLLMFPLFHVSGCQAVFLTSLMQGGKVVMMPRWNGEEALKLVEQEKITNFPGVPMMYWDMVKNPNLKKYDVSSMSGLSVGGQATPLSLFIAIKEAFPTAIIGVGYGMTETNGAISFMVGEDLLNNPTSVGHAVATSEIKLIDNGREVGRGERGEIYVRGATVMKGYDANPEANAKDFVDGWYRTGDIGEFDEDNRLYIVDRATEMVISSGENIYCAEVERVLSQADDVLEVTTFGMPDDRLGEKLIAFVCTQPKSVQSVESLIEFTKSKIAAYKVPVETYLLDEPLPRNSTGKVLKSQVREIYVAMS